MTFRGGARVGIFNATWPFAKLSMNGDSVRLKVFSKTYELKKNEVTRLEGFRGWFSSGVKIMHSSTGLDPHVVFWSSSSHDILAVARKLGFEIKDEKV
jgi:hypothetical protein